MKQLVLAKKDPFGWSPKKWTAWARLILWSSTGNIVFFNEAQAVYDPDIP